MIKLLFVLFSINSLLFSSYVGDGQSFANNKKEACVKALLEAKQEALERAGILIEIQNYIGKKLLVENGIKSYKKNFSFQTQEFSQGFIKVLSKKEKTTYNPETGQITCEVIGKFDIALSDMKKILLEKQKRFVIHGDTKIDTEKRIIYVKGLGVANQNFPKPLWKKSAQEAAKMDAKKKLAEFINGSFFKSEVIQKNYQIESSEQIEKIQTNINFASQVGNTKYLDTLTAEVILRMKY